MLSSIALHRVLVARLLLSRHICVLSRLSLALTAKLLLRRLLSLLMMIKLSTHGVVWLSSIRRLRCWDLATTHGIVIVDVLTGRLLRFRRIRICTIAIRLIKGIFRLLTTVIVEIFAIFTTVHVTVAHIVVFVTKITSSELVHSSLILETTGVSQRRILNTIRIIDVGFACSIFE